MASEGRLAMLGTGITPLIAALVGASAAPEPPAATLVVTEIMQNPDFTEDAVGEWFELTNVGAEPVDLEGWWIGDGVARHRVRPADGALVVEPGERVVLGRCDERERNGDVPVDYAWGDAFELANDAGSIVVCAADGRRVDTVAWDGGEAYPDPVGRAMALDPALVCSVANDAGGAWCAASTRIGGRWDNPNRGTPGAPNPPRPSQGSGISQVGR